MIKFWYVNNRFPFWQEKVPKVSIYDRKPNPTHSEAYVSVSAHLGMGTMIVYDSQTGIPEPLPSSWETAY